MILTNSCHRILPPDGPFYNCKLLARRRLDLLSQAQVQKQQASDSRKTNITSVRVVKTFKKGSSLEAYTLIDYLVRYISCRISSSCASAPGERGLINGVAGDKEDNSAMTCCTSAFSTPQMLSTLDSDDLDLPNSLRNLKTRRHGFEDTRDMSVPEAVVSYHS